MSWRVTSRCGELRASDSENCGGSDGARRGVSQ
jgi:hypothetical protein